MRTTQTLMMTLACLAAVTVALPTATAEPPAIQVNAGPGDCVVINENGTVTTDIPCLRRFVQNITEPAI